MKRLNERRPLVVRTHGPRGRPKLSYVYQDRLVTGGVTYKFDDEMAVHGDHHQLESHSHSETQSESESQIRDEVKAVESDGGTYAILINILFHSKFVGR